MPAYATTIPAMVGDLDPKMPQVGAILDQFVEMLAERVLQRLKEPVADGGDWLDTRAAAEHLGLHRDTVRRLAAERVISSEQDGPGCKLFFRRSELDAWRRSSGRHLPAVPGAAR